MTSPKNTPQDERDAREYCKGSYDSDPDADWTGSRSEVFTRQQDCAQHFPGAVGNAECFLRDAFLAGRLGYVPNQTVVAIAEAAAKEERERILQKSGTWTGCRYCSTGESLNEMLNPPEAK